MQTSARGFTLVELLVVIAIIAILSSIITVSLSSAKQKSRDSKRISDIKSIQLALSLYYNDNLFYPRSIYTSSFAVAGSDPGNGLSPAYLPVMPKDPVTNANYAYNAFTTSSSGICNTTNIPVLYHLGAGFEDTANTALTTQDADATQSLNNIYTSQTYYTCSGSTSFHGNAPNCSGTSPATPDNCYDVTP